MLPNYSFIIPHYNTPLLLLRCINSIPIRKDIQIIIVDDCSPNTEELRMVIKQVKQIPYVEFYNTPQNGGAGLARNIGITHAIGKWLIFADADDFFSEQLEYAMDTYLNAKEDVLYFNFQSVMSDDISQTSHRESNYKSFFEEYDKNYNENNFRFQYITPWGKFIKHELIVNHHILFDETRYANDVIFSVLIGCKADSILPIDIPLYVLTERNGSLTSKFCQKQNETAIRTQVALNAYSTIRKYGYDFSFNYQMFIQILIYNKEHKELLKFYHTIHQYGIKKSTILKIICNTGRCYFTYCLQLIIVDIWLTISNR